MANKNSDEIVQSLLHTALVRGATDNVTIICVQDGGDEVDDVFDDEATVVQRPFSQEMT